MQEYYPLNVQENVSVVIPKIQKSLESVSSCFSGSSFPTTNLQVGMLCMRTDDDNTLYQLVSTNPITWQSVGQDSVTAEKWANPITIQLKGMATSDAVSLDGSKNIDVNVTSIKATDIDDTFFTNLFKRFADKAFPVGFIWESTDATNPANILGVGTWESYGQGRVLVGAGQGSGLSNYTAGSTGGEEKHKLTTDELASHSHEISIASAGNHRHKINSKSMEAREHQWKQESQPRREVAGIPPVVTTRNMAELIRIQLLQVLLVKIHLTTTCSRI